MPDTLLDLLLQRPPAAPARPLEGVGPRVKVVNPWEGQPPVKATLLPQAGSGVSEANDPLLTGGQFLRGALGMGDNSTASRGGELLATLPFGAIPAAARRVPIRDAVDQLPLLFERASEATKAPSTARGVLTHLTPDAEAAYQTELAARKGTNTFVESNPGYLYDNLPIRPAPEPMQDALRFEGTPRYGSSEFIAEGNRVGLNDERQMKALDRAVGEKSRSDAATYRAASLPKITDLEGLNRHVNEMLFQRVQNKRLPLSGFPLVTADREVPYDEAASLYKFLEELGKSEASGPAALDKLESVHIHPNSASNITPKGDKMTIGTKDLLDGTNGYGAAAHEFQHAIDEIERPEIFSDYPYKKQANGLPDPAYWTHPSEIRANSRGILGQFDQASKEAGQLTLPRETIKPFADANAMFNGQRDRAKHDLYGKHPVFGQSSGPESQMFLPESQRIRESIDPNVLNGAGVGTVDLPDALSKALSENVSPRIPNIRDTKVTGYVAAPGKIEPPAGFDFPANFDPTVKRSPALTQRFEVEQNRFKPSNEVLPGSVGYARDLTQKRAVTMRSNVKVSPEIVREIRKAVAEGKSTPELLAKYSNIKAPTLRDIIKGDSWAWVK